MTSNELEMHLLILGLVKTDDIFFSYVHAKKFKQNKYAGLFTYKDTTIKIIKHFKNQIYVDIDNFRYMKLCNTYKCVIDYIEDYIYGSPEIPR